MEKSILRRGCQELQRYRERGKTKEFQDMVSRRLLVTLAMDRAGRVRMVKDGLSRADTGNSSPGGEQANK